MTPDSNRRHFGGTEVAFEAFRVRLEIVVVVPLHLQQQVQEHLEPIRTTLGYNASVVKIYCATNSMARFNSGVLQGTYLMTNVWNEGRSCSYWSKLADLFWPTIYVEFMSSRGHEVGIKRPTTWVTV
jgi:hypothetical protein